MKKTTFRVSIISPSNSSTRLYFVSIFFSSHFFPLPNCIWRTSTLLTLNRVFFGWELTHFLRPLLSDSPQLTQDWPRIYILLYLVNLRTYFLFRVIYDSKNNDARNSLTQLRFWRFGSLTYLFVWFNLPPQSSRSGFSNFFVGKNNYLKKKLQSVTFYEPYLCE